MITERLCFGKIMDFKASGQGILRWPMWSPWEGSHCPLWNNFLFLLFCSMISACVVCMHVQMYAWGYVCVYGTLVDARGPSLLSSYSCCPTFFLSRGLSLGCPATELLWATWLHLLRAGIPRTQQHAWPSVCSRCCNSSPHTWKPISSAPAWHWAHSRLSPDFTLQNLKPDNRGTCSVIGWSYLQAPIMQKAEKQASSPGGFWKGHCF